MKAIWKPYFKKYAPTGLSAILFLSLETGADLLQPTLLAMIINEGVKKGDLATIQNYGLLMLAVTLFGAVNASLRNILASKAAYGFGADLRSDLFHHTLTLSSANLDQFEGGSLITRITNDVSQVQNFAQGLMRIFLKAPLLGLGAVIMSVRLNPAFLWLYALILPLTVLIITLNMKWGYPLFRRLQVALDALNHRTQSFLAGIRVVKAFNRFDFEKKQFDQDNRALADLTAYTMKTMAVFPPLMSLTINAGIVYVLWRSSYWVSVGTIGLGDIMAVVNYLMQFLFALMVITRVFVMMVRAKASAERIEAVFDSHPLVVDTPAPLKTEIKGRLTFQDISFKFGQGKPVLEHITFDIEAGQTVGIIGPTGSGKSSIMHLIMRQYNPTHGSILLDGQPIQNYALSTLREAIGYVPQKTTLFTGTLLDNLKWGKRQATDEDIALATQMSQAASFIAEKPQGLETFVGRGGVQLSGGQKQRVAMARALLKTPKILLLDDSTSAIDVITENAIKTSLKTLKSKMTTLMVAQRITSIMDADQIIVLDQGQIQAMGTHQHLMATSALYQEIYTTQVGSEVIK